MTDSSVSKDQAKNACELIFKDMAEKVKKGLTISLPIPGVGVFKSKGSLCAVQFNQTLVSDAAGKTAKTHFQNKLFSSNNNRANLEILDANDGHFRTTMGGMISTAIKNRRTLMPYNTTQGPIQVPHDNNWMGEDYINQRPMSREQKKRGRPN